MVWKEMVFVRPELARDLGCCQWACHEKVVQCPEGFFFTADRSGTKSPLDSPLGIAVQRETVIVSQNDAAKQESFRRIIVRRIKK